ncbi:HNH endonuclease signature motif containing protein [Actinomycetospora callitridis]|uniref:HNH endonuclease signature motif containing protein n=1 Tax=Actinomycetospora callitridis TaxID=913944 RepID=UPI0023662548|nr:HNH endonuclease signature motif containing protein [Actinomycetospora callitridis]MDD7917017.1 DUF222 domain-containing protein [Actinomycetospora callitridis]
MSIDLDPTPGGVAGLEGLAPGSVLVAALEGVDPTCLAGAESIEYLRGCARARNRAAARFLTAVHEAGRAEDGTTTRRALVDEFSGDEVSTALGWSRSMAGRCLEFADDLHRRLVEVAAAMGSGELDEPKARVFSEWTRDLADDHAHQVCRVLLPEAPGLPVGALIARLQEVAGALDPEWAARRERAAEKRLRVVASRNPSGTANVSGCDLPMSSGVAIMARVDALALAVRRGGVTRRMAWLRGRVFERLLDGFAAGLTDEQLVPLLVAELGAEAPDDDDAPAPAGGAGGPEDGGPEDGGPGDDGGPEDGGPEDGGPSPAGSGRGDGGDGDPGGLDDSGSGKREPADAPAADAPAADALADGRAADDDAARADDSPGYEGDDAEGGELISGADPRAGVVREGIVEVRLRLSTALGLDDMPAHIPGWGTVLAGTARELLERHRRSEWRMVLTDDDGRLLQVLLPRRRPRSADRPAGPHRPGRRRGTGSNAIVELQAPATLLAALAPDDHDTWAPMLHELQHRLTADHPPDQPPGRPPDHAATPAQARRRRPGAEVDRWVRIRDRHCVAPGCRRPAHASDLDHTLDHALGGPSVSWNCGVWCRHHHRTKHEGGWRVTQPSPGRFHITTRAGARHTVEPPRITDPLPDPLPAPHPGDGPRPLPAHEALDPADDDQDNEDDDDQADDLAPSLPPETTGSTGSTADTAHRRGEALIDPPPPF